VTLQRHFTASVCVFNDEGAMLLVHHRKLDLWLYPGGHIDPDEAPDEAAKREVFEETGIEVEIIAESLPSYANVTARIPPWRIIEVATEAKHIGPHHHIDFVYVARVAPPGATHGSGQFTVAENEIVDCRWVPIDRFEDYKTPSVLPELAADAADWADRVQRSNPTFNQ
jgi:8-oxo-dGTP diphosphatase